MPKNRINCPSLVRLLIALYVVFGLFLPVNLTFGSTGMPNGGAIQHYQTEIRPNETLKTCLDRLQIKDAELYKAIAQKDLGLELNTLPTNTPIRLRVDASGKVLSFRVPLVKKDLLLNKGPEDSVDLSVLALVRPDDAPNKLKAVRSNEKGQVRLVTKSGTFDGNFFNVMDRQEIPDPVSDQFIRIFTGSVNFPRDLTRDSSFTMKYEVIYFDEHPIATGKILYSALNTPRKNLQGFWWKNKLDANAFYYSVDGQALSTLSWKTPILYSRKTSNFGMRADPFTGKWANHQGIDIGAPIGTEVRATQQGRIKAIGPQGPYGNAVILEHANGFETVYGHLNNFAKISANQVIPQGTLLGFVGNTGKSTGPHLHYELRKYGQAINPEQIFSSGTQAKQLEGDELKTFVQFQNRLLSKQVASR